MNSIGSLEETMVTDEANVRLTVRDIVREKKTDIISRKALANCTLILLSRLLSLYPRSLDSRRIYGINDRPAGTSFARFTLENTGK